MRSGAGRLAILGLAAAAGLALSAHAAPRTAAPAGLEALPRIAPGAGVTREAAARINRTLAMLDAAGRASAARCARMAADGPGQGGGWERSAAATFRGRAFYAVTLADSYYCGGPYPNDGLRQDYVFDLATGRPVDWVALFPKGARAERATAADGTPTGRVIWPALARRAEALAMPDCGGVFGDGRDVGFTIGLDEGKRVLTAVPTGLPHVIQACAVTVTIGANELARLGFAPRLVAALRASGGPSAR